MNKWFYRVALFVSVLVNIYFLLPKVHTEQSSAAATKDGPSGTVSATHSIVESKADDHASEIIAVLRAKGIRPRYLYGIAELLAKAELDQRRSAIQSRKQRYRWQHGLPSLKFTKEERDEMLALDLAEETRIQELLGPDFNKERANDLFYSNPKYALIPREKLAKLERMERERSIVLNDALRGLERGGPQLEYEALFNKVKEERQKDIEELFSPEELAAYELYHSSRAGTLQKGLNGSDVDDAQYEAIYLKLANIELQSMGGMSAAVQAIGEISNADAAVHYITTFDKVFGPSVSSLIEAGLSQKDVIGLHQQFYGLYAGADRDAARSLYKRIEERIPENQRAGFSRSRLGKELTNRMTPPPKPRS